MSLYGNTITIYGNTLTLAPFTEVLNTIDYVREGNKLIFRTCAADYPNVACRLPKYFIIGPAGSTNSLQDVQQLFNRRPVERFTAQTPAAPTVDASAAIEKKDNDGRFRRAHESFLARGKSGPIGVLFLGDSITAGWTKAPHICEH